ncbi:MAG: pilus assembly protein PilN [Proteobacteria bacterium]|nr:MAG: pilus assembly protein PilN [Pseudomonadota bacterium]
MPRINLLPWREQQRKERKLAFTVGIVGGLIAAGVVAFIGNLYFGSLIDAQVARNNRLKSEITQLDRQIEEINSLEAQKQKFLARMQIIEKLQRSRPEIVHVFDTFVNTVPDGTYLTGLTQTGTRFKIQGVAQSSTRVSAFMRNLDASQWLKNSELEVIEGKKENQLGSDFTLYAQQVSSAEDEPKPAPGAKGSAAARRTP